MSAAKKRQQQQEPLLDMIHIEVPLGEVPSGVYEPRHVEARLDAQQGHVLKALMIGLDQRGSRLANGRRVSSYADAVRWLLEQGISEC